jgi:hypothetical protein
MEDVEKTVPCGYGPVRPFVCSPALQKKRLAGEFFTHEFYRVYAFFSSSGDCGRGKFPSGDTCGL